MSSAVQRVFSRLQRPVAIVLVAVAALGPARAAPPNVSTAFQSVLIDGSAANSGFQSFNVILSGGTFHLWYRPGSAFDVTDIRHATSADGINFTTVGGAFSFGTNPFLPIPPNVPPALYFDAVSVVGGDYKIIHWTSNGDEGTFPAYQYNSSVSSATSNPNNTVLTHQGAVTGGTLGQIGGPFGIELGSLFGQCGATGQEVCRGVYTDASPPSVAGFPSVFNASALFTSLAIPTGYISNHGDVRPGGVGLDMAFTVRSDPINGFRVNQQVYFSESSDGGATWSAPVGLVGPGPTLDGGAFGAAEPNFSHPELLRTSGGALLYVSATNPNGEFIIAVSDTRVVAGPDVPVPTLSEIALALTMAFLALLAIPALRRRERTLR